MKALYIRTDGKLTVGKEYTIKGFSYNYRDFRWYVSLAEGLFESSAFEFLD